MNRWRSLWQRIPRWVWIGLLVLVVAFLALVVRYRLWMFLSDNPAACVACHVMDDHLLQYQHAEHMGEASCNDCHLSHRGGVAGRTLYKAKVGARHLAVYVMTPAGERDKLVLKARPETVQVAEDNCLRCHDEMDPSLEEGVASVQPGDLARLKAAGCAMPDEVDATKPSGSCLRCHPHTGHIETVRKVRSDCVLPVDAGSQPRTTTPQ